MSHDTSQHDDQNHDQSTTPETPQSTTVPLGKLRENEYNPRERLENIDELAASIEQDGLISPLTVRPVEEEEKEEDGETVYEVIAGMRRLAALRQVYDESQPIAVTIRDVDDSTARRLALKENIQRESLTPMEEARAFGHETEIPWCHDCETMVQDRHSGSQTGQNHHVEYLPYIEAIDRVGITEIPSGGHSSVERVSESLEGAHRTSTSFISNRLTLLQLPERGQRLVDQKEVPLKAGTMIGRMVREYNDRETAQEKMHDVLDVVQERWADGIPHSAYSMSTAADETKSLEYVIESHVSGTTEQSMPDPEPDEDATPEAGSDQAPSEGEVAELSQHPEADSIEETEGEGAEAQASDEIQEMMASAALPSAAEETETGTAEADETTDDDDDDDGTLELHLTIGGTVRNELELIASQRETSPDEIILEAIEEYIEREHDTSRTEDENGKD